MEKRKDDTVIRKGPWMAEEDEILKDYVKKYGPRDWSSIRSKGLLPRTGKSCRLRWVNKLKPDLKTSGCKFSTEEERVVIELQAKFGNKWARIATYLQGRTDNDVKNFWSTRQKRLGRIQQTSPLPHKSQRKVEKTPVPLESRMLEARNFSVVSIGEESSSSERSYSRPNVENFEVTKLQPIPEIANSNLLHLETNLPLLNYMPIIEKKPFDPLPQFPPFPQLPEQSLDLPLLPEGQDLITGLSDTNFLDVFPQGFHFPEGMPYFGFDGTGQNSVKHDRDNPLMPDNCFDDFPTDMFDY